MLTNKLIAELTENDGVIEAQYLVANASKATNRTSGATYWTIDLKDSSGQLNAKKWSIDLGDDDIFVAGNVINVKGEVSKYNDAIQIRINSASIVDPNEIDVNRFLKQPPVSKEELTNRFNNYVNSIKNKECKAILDWIINKIGIKLYDHPAAVSIHHDYLSGLLMHTVTMADIASSLVKVYDADYDVLITGVLLHDLGKTIELEGPIVFKYSLEGKLIGHISILSAMIKEAADELKLEGETPLLLQHMILSHHGQQEFGSPVLPSTKEALLLSLVDNLDCKMVALNKALETTKEGEFSNKIFSLDGRCVYKPKK